MSELSGILVSTLLSLVSSLKHIQNNDSECSTTRWVNPSSEVPVMNLIPPEHRLFQWSLPSNRSFNVDLSFERLHSDLCCFCIFWNCFCTCFCVIPDVLESLEQRRHPGQNNKVKNQPNKPLQHIYSTQDNDIVHI